MSIFQNLVEFWFEKKKKEILQDTFLCTTLVKTSKLCLMRSWLHGARVPACLGRLGCREATLPGSWIPLNPAWQAKGSQLVSCRGAGILQVPPEMEDLASQISDSWFAIRLPGKLPSCLGAWNSKSPIRAGNFGTWDLQLAGSRRAKQLSRQSNFETFHFQGY